MDTAAFIRTERNKKGLTQRQLATAAGVSAGLIGQWETGSVVPLERLIDLCAVFEIAPSRLFEDGQPFEGRIIRDIPEFTLVMGWRRLSAEKRNAVRIVLSGMGFSIPPEVDEPQAQQPG